MPWSQTSPMDQRTQFIADYLRESLSIVDLCALYGVSRKTGYKWIDRYLRFGPAGLDERSRKPRASPNQTGQDIVMALLEARRRHPSWGAKKLLVLLHKGHPTWDMPGRSTACDILSRHGMVPKQRQRRRIGHPGKPTSSILAPNDLWCADYKGQFKTGNGIYCYPLIVTDGYSRYLLCCQALDSTAVAGAKPAFTRLFKEYGLPKRIRSDNGVPFATTTLARLSALSAWWVRLGVMPEHIEPGKPQQNGSHERMHRTLKNETTRPPAGNLSASQRKFNYFRDEFNNERPQKRSINKLRLHNTSPRCERCPIKLRHSNTRIASRCATSALTAAFAGTTASSVLPASALASTLASRKSTTAYGTSISDRSSSAVSTSDTCALRINMAN